ncbi:hypothetical protein GCM10010300_20610 [Streptomyces olivaceoviridis]|uniref:hypothetical protein n=1 Tax=Streptomyces olivaceoviridis TaxID=1921 RepID=UPI0016769624|nr:hypothetical protein [Streptomyces olivaceoviridis]GGY76622.1 hypothetical protein GCM10010300_20610 [Streptomyces olivaceoviridis]
MPRSLRGPSPRPLDALTDDAAENTVVQAGDPSWHDYDLHVKATKKSGKEGFLVAFHRVRAAWACAARKAGSP